MATSDIWTYRDPALSGQVLTGYDVEAVDGGVGSVDEATAEAGSSFIVVSTGPWIFSKKAMLPAGVIERVDHEAGRVFVDRTRDEIRQAPEFDESRYLEPGYQDELGGYYATGRVGRAFDEPL
jgi:hypothetical protein